VQVYLFLTAASGVSLTGLVAAAAAGCLVLAFHSGFCADRQMAGIYVAGSSLGCVC
jgi:hypothetical protein